jgi:hypothetical protein
MNRKEFKIQILNLHYWYNISILLALDRLGIHVRDEHHTTHHGDHKKRECVHVRDTQRERVIQQKVLKSFNLFNKLQKCWLF